MALFVSVGLVIGGCIGWLVGIWKSKEEIETLKNQRQQWEHDQNVKSCANSIHFMAHQIKISLSDNEIPFTEDQFREWTQLPGWDGYVHEALDLLVKDGRAKPASKPGYWFIDWSNSSNVHK